MTSPWGIPGGISVTKSFPRAAAKSSRYISFPRHSHCILPQTTSLGLKVPRSWGSLLLKRSVSVFFPRSLSPDLWHSLTPVYRVVSKLGWSMKGVFFFSLPPSSNLRVPLLPPLRAAGWWMTWHYDSPWIILRKVQRGALGKVITPDAPANDIFFLQSHWCNPPETADGGTRTIDISLFITFGHLIYTPRV